MKPASPGLLALLASRQFYMIDLYTFTFINGGVLRYAGGDADVYANGLYYPCGGAVGPYFDRQDTKAKCTQEVHISVDQLVFDVLPGAAQLFGADFITACRTGLLDGAEFMMERLYMPTYGDTRLGTLLFFVGRCAEVDASRTIATFTINSHAEILNLNLPVNLYQSGCCNSWGDTNCGVVQSSFMTTGAVSAGSTIGTILATLAGGPYVAGTFDEGKIVFTSGALSGLGQSVKQCVFGTPDTISLIGYFPSAPAAGDTFQLFFGCDKTPGIPITTAALVTNGSNLLTEVADTSGLLPGQGISGYAGLPSGVTVVNAYTTTVLMSAPATAGSGTKQSLSFFSPNGCAKFSNQARYRGFPLVPQPTSPAG